MHPAFDAFVGIDWSGARGRYTGIAVARCMAGRSAPSLIPPAGGGRHWTRQAVYDWLSIEIRKPQRLLIGFDFAFALPGLKSDAFALWADVDRNCATDADLLGRGHVVHEPRFWLGGKRPADWAARNPHRATELACRAAKLGEPLSTLQLFSPKQVGPGALAGMRLLHRLHETGAEHLAIWPFDELAHDDTRSICLEIYPRLFIRRVVRSNAKLRDAAALNAVLAGLGSAPYAHAVDSDHATDALVSAAGLRLLHADETLWRAGAGEREGWIFGVPKPDDT